MWSWIAAFAIFAVIWLLDARISRLEGRIFYLETREKKRRKKLDSGNGRDTV